MKPSNYNQAVELDRAVTNAISAQSESLMQAIAGLHSSELDEAEVVNQIQSLKAEMERSVCTAEQQAYENNLITGSNAEKRKLQMDAITGPIIFDFQNRITALSFELTHLQIENKIGWAKVRAIETLLNYRAAIISNLSKE